MKKYTYYKVCLFTSLLGFGTLTSCVNTKDYANKNKSKSNSSKYYYSLINPTGSYRVHRYWDNHPKLKLVACSVLVDVIFTAITGVCYRIYNQATQLSVFSSGICGITGPNIPASSSNDAPMTDNINKTEKIIEAIKNGEEKWGKIKVFAAPVNNTLEQGKKNLTNRFDVRYIISDPTLLDDGTLKSIKSTRCDLGLMKCLMEQGLNLNAKDSQGVSLLTFSIIHDNQSAFEFLIDNGVDVENAEIDAYIAEVESPLAIAVLKRNKKIVSDLISKGAGVNMVNKKYNMTPAMTAAWLGYTDIFKFILEDANPCQENIKSCIDRTFDPSQGFYSDLIDFMNLSFFDIKRDDNSIKNMTETLNKAIQKNKAIDRLFLERSNAQQ